MVEVLVAAITAVAAIAVALLGTNFRTIRRVERNTRPNGHGPLPDAISELHSKVDLLVNWQGAHDFAHEINDARNAARIEASTALMRRLEAVIAKDTP